MLVRTQSATAVRRVARDVTGWPASAMYQYCTPDVDPYVSILVLGANIMKVVALVKTWQIVIINN